MNQSINQSINEIDNFRVHSNVTYSVNISNIFGMKPSKVYSGWCLQDSGTSGGAIPKGQDKSIHFDNEEILNIKQLWVWYLTRTLDK